MCTGGWWRAHGSHPFSHTPWGCPVQPPAAPGSQLQKQQLLGTSVSPEVTMELDSHHSHIACKIISSVTVGNLVSKWMLLLSTPWDTSPLSEGQQDIFQPDFTDCRLQILPSVENALAHLQTHLSLNSVGPSTGSLQCPSLIKPPSAPILLLTHPRDTKTCSERHQSITGPNWLFRKIKLTWMLMNSKSHLMHTSKEQKYWKRRQIKKKNQSLD